MRKSSKDSKSRVRSVASKKSFKPIICIVGLGYVGLPLAAIFARRGVKTYGFDVQKTKIQELKKGIERMNEVDTKDLKSPELSFSNDPSVISKANFVIVCVPTPITKSKRPDLGFVKSASRIVGEHLKKGSYVIFESTVYPGVTEDVCVPLIEKASGLTCGKDWIIGYSPERVNPADKKHTINMIQKVVSGMNKKTCAVIASVYRRVIDAGVFEARSIRVAEAAKVIENIQRDLNIALMNELAIIFEKMGIPTPDVLEAAATKWNFIKMRPGLVGGHCIGVDPYYLIYKAERMDYHPQIIGAGRKLNDDMSHIVGDNVMKMLIKANKKVSGSNVLILGVTFKENVGDIRNTKIVDLINHLSEFGIKVSCYDPLADYHKLQEEYNLSRKQLISKIPHHTYDLIVYAVDHKQFSDYNLATFEKMSSGKVLLYDIPNRFHKQLYSEKKTDYTYKSL